MSRSWFSQPLETVATFWRVLRRDGVALGFTTHDADLWFGGVLHRTAPGMLPSAIRRSADLEPDSAEVDGALSHEALSEADLARGRFDGARVLVGLVDWESLENLVIYQGEMGTVTEESGKFNASLTSRKAELQRDPVPRTSPTCRAEFCGPGCGLSVAAFEYRGSVIGWDIDANRVAIDTAVVPDDLVGGRLRWLDGPLAGMATAITDVSAGWFTLSDPLDVELAEGLTVCLREACDRTLTTCAERFGNAANFQGEPYLPGNDLIARYPIASQ